MVRVCRVNPVRGRAIAWILLGVGAWLARPAVGGSAWVPIGPALGGTVLALAVDPATPTTLYLSTRPANNQAPGGAFKSIDGGTSWTSCNAGLAGGQVFQFAIDSSQPATIYAAASGIVFKSTDGARTWTAINAGLGGHEVVALALDPESPSTLYAGASQGGVFRTTNGGKSWRPTSLEAFGRVLALVVTATRPSTIYVATENGGVFRSSSGGNKWTLSYAGLSGTLIFSLAIDPLRGDPARWRVQDHERRPELGGGQSGLRHQRRSMGGGWAGTAHPSVLGGSRPEAMAEGWDGLGHF